MPHSLARWTRVAVAVALGASPVVSRIVVPHRLAAQTPPAPTSSDVAVAFDDGGRLREITPGIADRLGLRAPWWPVQGEYKRARLLRTDAATWVLEVQRFAGPAERLPLDDDQVGQLRLEVSARAGALTRATGRPIEAPALATASAAPSPAAGGGGAAPSVSGGGRPPAAGATGDDPPIARGAFIARETLLGATLFAPAAWIAADARAFSPSAALFTAAGSYLLATNAVNRAPFGRGQTSVATLAALGGAAGGAGLAFAAGVSHRPARALSALVGGVGLHVAALGWSRGIAPAEAHGTFAGALAGGAVVAGALGAGRVFDAESRRNDRWTAGALSVGVLAAAPLGRWWVQAAPHRITAGDLGATAVAAAVTASLGYGLVGAGAASPAARYGVPTVLGLGGAWLGDRLLAAPYDHDAADVGTLATAGAVGAAIAVLPYRLAGNRADGTAWTLGALGAVVGVWGGEIVTRPRAGGTRVQFAPAGLLGVLSRTPGVHSVMSIQF